MKLKKLHFLLILLTLSKCFQEASSKENQNLEFLSEPKNDSISNNLIIVNAPTETPNFFIYKNQIENKNLAQQEIFNFTVSKPSLINTQINQPIAVLHGIGDDCDGWMFSWTQYLGAAAETYAKCIESGGNIDSELISTIKQAEKACQLINEDEHFNGNFTIVGFSQGGLIGRYILQQCEMKGTVTKFISLGSPHMGISRVPWPQGPLVLRGIVDFLINIIAFIPGINNFYSPLSYLNPPLMQEFYRRFGSYLSVINNEVYDEKFHLKFKSRFENLQKLVLIKFKKDEMVIPKESAWFQKYDWDYQVQNLEQSEFYQKDYLGLRFLIESGKVSFFEFEGGHMVLTQEQMDKFVVPALLS